jgi:hypothetical protein
MKNVDGLAAGDRPAFSRTPRGYHRTTGAPHLRSRLRRSGMVRRSRPPMTLTADFPSRRRDALRRSWVRRSGTVRGDASFCIDGVCSIGCALRRRASSWNDSARSRSAVALAPAARRVSNRRLASSASSSWARASSRFSAATAASSSALRPSAALFSDGGCSPRRSRRVVACRCLIRLII